MVDIKQIITYLDIFGTKNSFYTNQKPELYTLMGGILTLLSFFLCFIVFIFQSLNDFKRISPITSISSFTFDINQRKIKFGEKKIWIPWRIVDRLNNNFFNHTNILFPIIHYYYGKKENNTMNYNSDILNYKLCNETSMKKYSKEYILNVPLNEIYCIDMEDLEIGGSRITDFLNFVEFGLYFCKNGIDYNETNLNCTLYEKLMNLTGEGNSLKIEFYFPEIQFQPTNLTNPIIIKYSQFYYHLSRFLNRVDRIYLQENIFNDDNGLIISKNKNYSYWGIGKKIEETHFTINIKDLNNEISTSRAYSIKLYLYNQVVYYKRHYKKINAIFSENFPITFLIFITVKKIAQILKLAEGKEEMTELLFDKLNDKPKIIKIMKKDLRNEQLPNINSAMNINNNLILKTNNIKNQSTRNKVLGTEVYDKTNIRSDKSGINLMPHFEKKNDFNKISDFHQNINQDSFINQIVYVHNTNNNKKVKELFPYRYYLFSEFIKNIDIGQYYRCCFSQKYTKVYKFIGKLFDVSSYLILQREFNIIKNSTFKQKELNFIERDIKINLNDRSFMRDVNDFIGGVKFDIFSKNLKDYKKNQ